MSDPLWFKDAVIYELHVRSFCDGDGDGIGDFEGLTGKLGYLKELGATALWLMPFYASPLLDDGYDVTDHCKVNPLYGTLAGFKRFLAKAHAHGLRVITELVLNHTSDCHPWFRRARKAKKGSKERGFYVWSDDPNLYRDARVILSDTEPSNWTWDPVAKQHYWHRFAAHQPDLNFDNPAVGKAIRAVVDFWMGLGVDGMRLDAVPFLFERDGTSCENLPETHAFLRELRAHVDEEHAGKVLLGEACQWPEDLVPYFGNGDECHMNLQFPLVPRLFLALAQADRTPIVELFTETPAIPNACQWATFLRNHDDLSLEIVTEEERIEMWERYAEDPRSRSGLGIRRRLAPLLGGDRTRIELMHALLLALPGTPVLYYGDEIGMGDDPRLPDRHGLRTPMQWDDSSNAGFSKAPRKKLAFPPVETEGYHWNETNVEAQQGSEGTLLDVVRMLLDVRTSMQVFGRGSIRFLEPENESILAFVREHAEHEVLVVCNLSGLSQSFELELHEFAGRVPIEMFEQSRWHTIGLRPYGFTLFGHGFLWLELAPAGAVAEVTTVPEAFDVGWLRAQRWFGSKDLELEQVLVLEAVAIPKPGRAGGLVVSECYCDYERGGSDAWFLFPGQGPDDIDDPRIGKALLEALLEQKTYRGDGNAWHAGKNDKASLRGETTSALRKQDLAKPPKPERVTGEHSSSSLLFGEKAVLKVVRKVEVGENPDFEVPRFLRERAGFAHMAPALGVLRLHKPFEGEATVAILHAYVPNIGDAWRVLLGQLAEVRRSGPMASLHEAIGHAQGLTPLLERLGRRLGQMHLALASEREDRAFAPEPFTAFYVRGLFQSLRDRVRRVWTRMPKRLVVPTSERVIARFEALRKKAFAAERTRTHGDLHLGQVLVTPDRDAVFIDFEGDPSMSLAERKVKHCPLRDVAGIVRSLHRAAAAAVRAGSTEAEADPKRLESFGAWCEGWRASATEVFLEAYFTAAAGASFLPRERADLRELLDLFVLDAAVRELGDALRHAPDRVAVPLAAIAELLEVES